MFLPLNGKLLQAAAKPNPVHPAPALQAVPTPDATHTQHGPD